MAKATTARQPQGKRPPAAPDRPERGNSLMAIYQELRKVTWPTWRELSRMTQVVAATVILFAFFIGGLDLVLSFVAKPLYTQPGTVAPRATLHPGGTHPGLPAVPSQQAPVPSAAPTGAAPTAPAPGAPTAPAPTAKP